MLFDVEGTDLEVSESGTWGLSLEPIRAQPFLLAGKSLRDKNLES